MKSRQTISQYNKSIQKMIFNYLLIVLSLPLIIPVFILITFLIAMFSSLPIFFIQKRVGKKGKIFKMIKFRTMVKDADRLQSKYTKLNEADGPVFKIKNDPRYTKFGKQLSRTGLDELPQLLNVLRGEMYLVGPRPLPTYEANKLNKVQKFRLLVKPGITSSWIVNGNHRHTFKTWMDMDKDYVQNATLATDVKILSRTFSIPVNYILGIFKKNSIL